MPNHNWLFGDRSAAQKPDKRTKALPKRILIFSYADNFGYA